MNKTKKVPFITWLLATKSESNKYLFHTIERDTNNVYYFCTTKETRIEACNWLNNLKTLLNDTFHFDEIDNVTSDEIKIRRSYRSIVSKYSKDPSTTYNKYFALLNIDIENNAEKERDNLENVWTKPPK
eukprot:14723562-Ditylum_brightwellii.AAC.1